MPPATEGGGGGLPTPRVLVRNGYEPYGGVRSVCGGRRGVRPPRSTVGHHGLIALEADASLVDLTHGPNTGWWSTGGGGPLSADTQNLLYLTPNRVLSTRLGRWL